MKPILIIICFGLSFFCSAQKVTLNISGIDNSNGHLQISIFESAVQFEDEEPAEILFFDKSGMIDGKKSITIDLTHGIYGIVVLDDEDQSKDMTYRFGIYPLEGVGFSNFQFSGLSKPDFDEFDFEVLEDNMNININMKNF